jgi:hypothetical protein
MVLIVNSSIKKLTNTVDQKNVTLSFLAENSPV